MVLDGLGPCPCPPKAGGRSSEFINARVLAARKFARPDRGPGSDVLSESQCPSNGGARRRNVFVAGLTYSGDHQSDSVNFNLQLTATVW